MNITHKKLFEAGFLETRYRDDQEGGSFYTKRLAADEVPYARDNIIDGDLVMPDDDVIVEVTPDQRVQLVVDVADVIVEPVPVDSDAGRDLLRGMGIES